MSVKWTPERGNRQENALKSLLMVYQAIPAIFGTTDTTHEAQRQLCATIKNLQAVAKREKQNAQAEPVRLPSETDIDASYEVLMLEGETY